METILRELRESVISGRIIEAEILAQNVIEKGLKAVVILNEGLIPAMREVGQRFEVGEFFLPEMLIAAEAMKTALSIISPLLLESEIQSEGTVIIGAVSGDMHDIGKNLVAVMLKGTGFKVVDLGKDVAPERFVSAVKEYGPQIVCLSALLTTTMLNMKEVIKALEAGGIRNDVKVIVGGAPLTQEYANQIGADGYASDASSAVRVAKELI